MFAQARLRILLGAYLLFATAASGQQATPQTQPSAGKIFLDVVVTAKAGGPIGDLQQQDFTVLDNNAPRAISSFEAVTGRDAPIGIVLAIDAINATAVTVATERDAIDKFLHEDDGYLAYPVAIEVVTDTGIQNIANFTNDGDAQSAALQKSSIGLRDIGRSGAYWGATERLQMSLKGLSQLVERYGPLPGRKLILWISPGWPLLNDINTALNSAQQQQLFESIVGISTDLRRAGITLNSIDPIGAAENPLYALYYEQFLKGVSKPSQVHPGDVGLQVIAVQSGGLALNSGNDMTNFIEECVGDAAPYYEISFVPAPAAHADEYHSLEVKIDKPGLTARTRQGYYAQPASAAGN
jgi:VWFA-related protein